MSLVEHTLFGTTDKVAASIARIQEFEPEDGFFVAYSGGKDSVVALDLVKRADVDFDAHYAVTTVDPPELTRFIREHAPEVIWDRPETSMFKLIPKHRFPPTRRARYCCDYLKERGGDGRFVITGIRWAESSRRSRRMMTETCRAGQRGRRLLHPIIDWSDDDVWAYIRERQLPYCSLYDEGFKRLGCVMCPLSGRKQMLREAERWPKIAAMYLRACRKAVAGAKASEKQLKAADFEDGDAMYRWWLGEECQSDDPQLFPMDN